MITLALLSSVLLLASGESASACLPPLESVDGAGRTLPDAAAPRRVTKEVVPPQPITRVKPDFRRFAGLRTTGVIILESVIDKQGTVCAARVISKRNDAAAQAALDALRQWRFKPALVDGRPEPVYFTMTVNIDLQ